MGKVSLIFQLAINILDWLIMVYYFRVLSEKRFKSLWKIIEVSLVYITIITYINQYIQNTWANLVISVSSVIALSVFFEVGESKRTKAIYDTIYIGLSILSELFGICLCWIFGDKVDMSKKADYIFVVCISKILLVLFCYFVARRKSLHKRILSREIELLLVFSTILFTVIIIAFATKVDSMDGQSAGLYFGTTLGCVYLELILYILLDKFQKLYEENLENQKNQQIMEQQKERLKLLEEKEQEIRGIRHDLKNQLLELNIKLDKEDDMMKQNKEAKIFVESMIGRLEKSYHYTSNFTIDTILKEKIVQARKKGIDVICQINVAEDFSLETGDMGVILGNLLDNAIEAAEQTTKPSIQVNIKQHNHTLYMGIKNTLKQQPQDGFVTTKQNKKNHGYGLGSVKNVVKKYGGDFRIFYDEHFFEVEIVLIRHN